MGFISQAMDNITLSSQYLFRRLGMPSFQIHQIYLPKQQLLYIPIPKNTCTTIKHERMQATSGS
jgi:hypothetical protein